MEKQPDFIFYTAIIPASPAERLGVAAMACMSIERVPGQWFYIFEGDKKPKNPISSTLLGCEIRPNWPKVWAEVTDRGQGPELVMEFFNCKAEGLTDNGDGHTNEAW